MLRRVFLRYANALQEQTAQSVACNSRHTLQERCARWLLATHDRVGRDQFVLLQSFLAAMLGVHRPRVTIAASKLQQAGLISYSRGKLAIIDRERLEDVACECYVSVKAASDRMLALAAD
jgi:Mn-dependent DtxR family transcriptional regulator